MPAIVAWNNGKQKAHERSVRLDQPWSIDNWHIACYEISIHPLSDAMPVRWRWSGEVGRGGGGQGQRQRMEMR